MSRWFVLLSVLVFVGLTHADSREEAIARGRKALVGRSFNPPVWGPNSYDSLWKQWGLPEKPADYDRAVRDHYGLHPAPYANDGLPMGIRKGTGFSVDCLICHGGSIVGQSYIGLGNSTLDVQAVF